MRNHPQLARRRSLLQLALACTLIAALPGCSTPTAVTAAPAAPAPGAEPPRLIVFMVVDGLPMRQVLAYRDQLQPDGFRRFLDRGAWFSQAFYGHGYTVTAAGHSIMLSGAYPERSGIIGNEWHDRDSDAPRYNTDDPAHHYIDHATPELAGTSPRNYRAETVGDVLRTQDPLAKVIGISGKDRGAILPAGHLGTAYMYMSSSGGFASSSYYMASHPRWVQDFNAGHPADRFFGKAWTPLLSDPGAYARSAPDGQSWQSNSGNGNRLPAVMGAGQPAPNERFWGGLLASPFGDELTLDFARAALEGEQLGRRGHTDLLSISLSSHDYVNHAFGPESMLSQDHFLHLDRHLQAFFKTLDERIGPDRYLVVLTADHGFMDTPEWARLQGRDAGRLAPATLISHLNQGLSARFGEGSWVRRLSTSGLLFDEALIRARGLQPDAVYDAARDLALKENGIAAAFSRTQLAGSDTSARYLAQMRHSWNAALSPMVMLVPRPGWMFSSASSGSTHGSPHPYDTQVPLLAWGPGFVGQGEVSRQVEIIDLAPSLARLLQIPVPAQSQGRPLPWPATSSARQY